jgi:hypothetical protein
MNLLRNGLLMRKTGDRRRSDMSEKYAFVCGFSAEFITLSSEKDVLVSQRTECAGVHKKV